MSLNERSRKNLAGVHPDLVAVVERARERCDFLVTEGLRTKERQAFLVKAGKSQTQNSRHLYGLAVDLCDCDGCYDIPDMHEIAKAMKAAAIELEVPIRWGGDWKTFKDTPHFELDRSAYPDDGKSKPKVIKPADKKAATAVAVGAGGGLAIPAIPAPPAELVSGVADWQKHTETLLALTKSPAFVVVICAILFAVFAPKIRDRFAR